MVFQAEGCGVFVIQSGNCTGSILEKNNQLPVPREPLFTRDVCVFVSSVVKINFVFL